MERLGESGRRLESCTREMLEVARQVATFVLDGAGLGISFSAAAPDCHPAFWQYGNGTGGGLLQPVEDIVCHCLACDNTAFVLASAGAVVLQDSVNF